MLLFDCTDESLKSRLGFREEKRIGEDPNILQRRLEIFSHKTLPVIHYFESRAMLVRISSEPDKNRVFGVAQKYFRPLPFFDKDFICIMGCHSSGKSTLAKNLSQRLGGIHLCISDLIRAEVDRGFHLGSQLMEDMKIGNQINTDVVLYLVQRSLERYKHIMGQPFILDGFPFDLEQLEAFERTVGHVKLIINLNATAKVVCGRNLNLGQDLSERKHLVYTKSIQSLEQALSGDSRYYVIDASKNPEDIASISTLLSQKFVLNKTLSVGDSAPNFVADTTNGIINFYFWKGESWTMLFSYPETTNKHDSDVMSELCFVAKIQNELNDRSVKVIGLNCDTLDNHSSLISEIEETQNISVSFPIIADCDQMVSLSYGMLKLKDEMEVLLTPHSVFIIDPQNNIRAIFSYPASVYGNFEEILGLIDSLQASDKSNISPLVNLDLSENIQV